MAATEGGVTGVHEADAWVDPILRAKPVRDKMMKLETLDWRLKALLPCFRISLYFWFPESTLLRFLTVWPSSVRGERKIQAMSGSSLLRLSYTKMCGTKRT